MDKTAEKLYFYQYARGMWSVSVSHCLRYDREFSRLMIGQFSMPLRHGLYAPLINDFVM